MTQPTAFASDQVVTGIGKETGGYGVAVGPSYFWPMAAPIALDRMVPLPDQGWRGPPADSFGHVPGPNDGAQTLTGLVYADTIGFPFASILGDVASSGSGPVTWTMAVQNSGAQPPSYTLSVADGVNNRRWPGLKFTSLTLTSNADGLLAWSGAAVSLASVIVAAPAQAWGSVEAIAGWRLAATIGGSADATVLSSRVTLARAVTAKTNTDGTQTPYLQYSGLCTVNGQLELILQTDTYRGLYVAGTPSSVDLNYQQGAGASLTQTLIHCSDVILTDVHPDYSSSAYQRLVVAWSADYNTTDVGASGGWSPVKVTLKNAVPAGTYA